LVIDGARQIGKSYIIHYVATKLSQERFPNYIEVNFLEILLGKSFLRKSAASIWLQCIPSISRSSCSQTSLMNLR
jgi:predicted AAA+ superfamily ATPase